MTFISFEGIEGSGKSTLLASVEHRLVESGNDVVVTREPGGTRAGDAVRSIFLRPDLAIDPLTEVLLVNASRAQLVAEVITPALARGAVVLCDRYVDSSLAYQGYGRGVALETIRSACEIATQGLMPDITILVDVPVETSRRRLQARGDAHDRLEREHDAFHRRVRDGYLDLARRYPRIAVVDGDLEPDEVFGLAMKAISAAVA